MDMMVSPLRTFWRRHRRRLTVLAVLSCVLACLTPLHIRLPTLPKDASRPFPCQSRPCGCRSAEQCWKKCCCFTNSQKVAWAKAHEVELPQSVIAAAKREQPSRECGSESCQSKVAPRSAPISKKKATVSTDRHVSRYRSTQGADNHGKLIIGVFAQECQGQAWGWFALPWSILNEGATVLATLETRRERSSLPSVSCSSRTLKPPVPPPRHLTVAPHEV